MLILNSEHNNNGTKSYPQIIMLSLSFKLKKNVCAINK